MIKYFLISSFLTVLLISCTKSKSFPNVSFKVLPIESATFPDTLNYQENVQFTLRYLLPDSSYDFYSLYYQTKNDSARVVAINSIINEDISNPTKSKDTIETKFNLSVSQKKDYTFLIYKGDDSEGNNVFDTILVPVKVP